MTQVIDPTDEMYFTFTSNADYDRHNYKIVSKTGESIIVTNYESARSIWFNKSSSLSHIDVLDIKQKPATKGFKK
jgi:hypothetical protein